MAENGESKRTSTVKLRGASEPGAGSARGQPSVRRPAPTWDERTFQGMEEGYMKRRGSARAGPVPEAVSRETVVNKSHGAARRRGVRELQ